MKAPLKYFMVAWLIMLVFALAPGNWWGLLFTVAACIFMSRLIDMVFQQGFVHGAVDARRNPKEYERLEKEIHDEAQS